MLRYFYFLCIIYFINSSFCYDYLNEDHQRTRESGNRGDDYSRRKIKATKKSMHKKRQHYQPGNNEPVAHFDVADFMLSYDGIVDGRPRQVDTPRDFRRRISKDYNNYDSFESLFNIEANDKTGNGWANVMEDEENNVPEAPSTSKMLDQPNEKNLDYSFTGGDVTTNENMERINYLSKSLYDPNIVARSPTVHHHQKKGVLKNIRFPFFSRNKVKTLGSTKDRKRMTSKNPKPEGSKSLVDLNDQVVIDDKDSLNVARSPSEPLNKRESKRSYFEKICPACKKKYVPNQKAVPRSEQVPDRIIHNSRQFFQNQVEGRSSNKDKKNLASMPESERRERRQYLDEKERQLKEIEEVARKVESVNVRLNASPTASTALFISRAI